mgnify:CR=1 FL=1
MTRPTLYFLVLASFAISVDADSTEEMGERASPTPTKLKPLTREMIDELERLRGAIEAVDDMKRGLDTSQRVRFATCLKAFGHSVFCKCVNETMGIGLSFDGYFIANTRTDQELNLGALEKDERDLIENARNARETCVTKL